MSGRHAVPSRLGGLYREVAKFGVVGISGFVVNLAIFNLIRNLAQWQTVRASVLATACAIMTNYLGLRYFTYRDRGQESRSSRRRELGLFAFFSAVGLVIENAVLYATTYGFGWDGTLANNVWKFVGIGIATLFRFWSYRTWVFGTSGGEPVPTADAPGGEAPVHHVPPAVPADPFLTVSWEKT
ncbi:GtrA family protein [Streptomyces sp. NPDC088354]|uniref:GtrA family protein n=1 Tax=Streptomyces sp. NPDC088354 TaxID=3365856 RepID=UPI0038093501